MTPNLQMEQLSLAYVRAVAAGAGYQVSIPNPDVDSVDGVLASSMGRRPRIEFQAKLAVGLTATLAQFLLESHTEQLINTPENRMRSLDDR